ncbi:phage minor tail protein G [Salmonella enterica subsp. enterica serovar Eastbourne]|uniref:Phage minor tail protein G n=1 Tax=Salmonella enterica subsp. enterica serovar Eastbourne TaxID=486993 RepID=A0A702BIT3_SALET|nr:phage minor tail protein G [Salmonella enterica subsp. enterica serovar Eastbourne]ECA1898217.1 phage minor tail protein G [Salmonella enterica subsp. enterica serovar Eastbourne]HAC6678763.1 phage minor tail protein G [Salmonella enterica subsp. enterica serovar Eastbourne]HAE5116265.1 phage minor tail protein G [Salmonella enterica subsp. enterica serovar Eastbourne]HAE8030644.1 phage minor tail protein G [Salmonella enterica subsp. enterica serovar Eastbourne]
MFLKKDTLTYGDASVELYELSGLQRIEYLEYIQQRTAQYDREAEESTEEERRVAFLRMGVDINAWLVSRSLQNGDPTRDTGKTSDNIAALWSYEALGKGADMVLSLSGMTPPDSDSEEENTEADSPEKS